MAASRINVQTDALFANDTAVADNKFGDVAIRDIDAGDSLQKDDVVRIPKDYQVKKTKFSENGEEYPYIPVEVYDGQRYRPLKFFPNNLVKSVFPYDEHNNRLPKQKASGTATNLFVAAQKAGKNIDGALEELTANHTQDAYIKVTASTFYKVGRYQEEGYRQTAVNNWDLASAADFGL